jgi:hypothetical protein
MCIQLPYETCLESSHWKLSISKHTFTNWMRVNNYGLFNLTSWLCYAIFVQSAQNGSITDRTCLAFSKFNF